MSNIALQVQLTTCGSVEDAANVVFDNIVYSNGNISYNASNGVVTFLQAGQYTVNWWVSTLTSMAANGLTFAISTSQGDHILGSTPVKTGEMYGIGVLDVSAGTTLSLVNSTGYCIVYANEAVNASMMIVESPHCIAGPTGPTGPTGAHIYTQPPQTRINKGFHKI